jgi:hypothetical protein
MRQAAVHKILIAADESPMREFVRRCLSDLKRSVARRRER